MPTTVVAKAGQSLCDLAVAAGFLDCQPIRDEGGNAGKPFLTKPLQAGEKVVIPDIQLEPADKGVETEHVFEKKNAPGLVLRFVHGSPAKPYKDDDTLTVLNVSKYVTDQGGGPDGDANLPTEGVCEF